MHNDAADSNDSSALINTERLMFDTFGIRFLDPYGAIRPRNGWAIFGSLILTSSGIEIVPRYGTDATQRGHLVTMAGKLWLRGLGDKRGWKYHPELGWVAGVAGRYPFFDRPFLAAMPSMCSSSSGSTRTPSPRPALAEP